MKDTAERRIEIIKYLCKCRASTVEQLAFEFEVSTKTISRDLTLLSLSHPIEVRQGRGGGVFVMEGYRLGKVYLKDRQETVIRKYIEIAPVEDKEDLESILTDFAKPKVS